MKISACVALLWPLLSAEAVCRDADLGCDQISLLQIRKTMQVGSEDSEKKAPDGEIVDSFTALATGKPVDPEIAAGHTEDPAMRAAIDKVKKKISLQFDPMVEEAKANYAKRLEEGRKSYALNVAELLSKEDSAPEVQTEARQIADKIRDSVNGFGPDSRADRFKSTKQTPGLAASGVTLDTSPEHSLIEQGAPGVSPVIPVTHSNINMATELQNAEAQLQAVRNAKEALGMELASMQPDAKRRVLSLSAAEMDHMAAPEVSSQLHHMHHDWSAAPDALSIQPEAFGSNPEVQKALKKVGVPESVNVAELLDVLQSLKSAPATAPDGLDSLRAGLDKAGSSAGASEVRDSLGLSSVTSPRSQTPASNEQVELLSSSSEAVKQSASTDADFATDEAAQAAQAQGVEIAQGSMEKAFIANQMKTAKAFYDEQQQKDMLAWRQGQAAETAAIQAQQGEMAAYAAAQAQQEQAMAQHENLMNGNLMNGAPM